MGLIAKNLAPGEARTPDLRISLSVLTYKYDALTDCATGAMVGQKFSMVQVLKKMHKNSRSFLRLSSDKAAKNVSRRRIVVSTAKNRQIFQYEPLFRNFCF